MIMILVYINIIIIIMIMINLWLALSDYDYLYDYVVNAITRSLSLYFMGSSKTFTKYKKLAVTLVVKTINMTRSP